MKSSLGSRKAAALHFDKDSASLRALSLTEIVGLIMDESSALDSANLMIATQTYENKLPIFDMLGGLISRDVIDSKLVVPHVRGGMSSWKGSEKEWSRCEGTIGLTVGGLFVCEQFCDTCVQRLSDGFCYLFSFPLRVRWRVFLEVGVYPELTTLLVKWKRYGFNSDFSIHPLVCDGIWTSKGIVDRRVYHFAREINTNSSRMIPLCRQVIKNVCCEEGYDLPQHCFLFPPFMKMIKATEPRSPDDLSVTSMGGKVFVDPSKIHFTCKCGGSHLNAVFYWAYQSAGLIGAPFKVPTVMEEDEEEAGGSSINPGDSASITQFTEQRISEMIEEAVSRSALGNRMEDLRGAVEPPALRGLNQGVNSVQSQLQRMGAFSDLGESVMGYEDSREYGNEVMMTFCQSGVHLENGVLSVENPPSIGAASLVPARTTDKRLNFLMQLHAALFKLLGDDPYPPRDFMEKFRRLRNEQLETDHPSFDLLQNVLENTINWRQLRVKRNIFKLPIFEEGMHLNEMLIANSLISLYYEYRTRWLNLMKDVVVPQKIQLMGSWSNSAGSSRRRMTGGRKDGKSRI